MKAFRSEEALWNWLLATLDTWHTCFFIFVLWNALDWFRFWASRTDCFASYVHDYAKVEHGVVALIWGKFCLFHNRTECESLWTVVAKRGFRAHRRRRISSLRHRRTLGVLGAHHHSQLRISGQFMSIASLDFRQPLQSSHGPLQQYAWLARISYGTANAIHYLTTAC